MIKIKNYNDENGLTMIELIVAIGIFSLVVGMVSGILVLSLQNQRKIIATRNVGDNVRFAMESISREIRTGQNFSGGGNSLSFTNAKGGAVIYRLDSGVIEKSSDGGTTYSAVTGVDVTIDYLNFYLMGQVAGDGLQPRVTITMSATSRVGNQSANLKSQTTLSERLPQS